MSATILLVLLACLLIAAKFAGWVCHRLHVPAVLGQLLVGVIVGPSMLGWVQVSGTLDAFANLGVIILMFIAGIETDMPQMRKVGGAAFVSAMMGVICPFVVGTIFALALLTPGESVPRYLADCNQCQHFRRNLEGSQKAHLERRNNYSGRGGDR